MVSISTKVFVFVITIISVTQGQQRIIGGEEAPSHFGLFHVSLQNLNGHHVCGGAVVSRWHVLTAAHCIYGAAPEHIVVMAGTTNLDSGGGRYEVASISIYNEFNFTSKVNDIGLIKVQKPFDLKYVSVIRVYEGSVVEDDVVFLSGFGAQMVNGDSSTQMQFLALPIFSQEVCVFAMRYTREVTDCMFCTFTRIGEGTCNGDSGSPIIKDGKLIGLVSWGIPCATGFPDVHVRVSPFIEWIRSEILKC